MSNRRLVFALILGLVLAIFVSACGIAVGPVQFTAAGPAVLSPTFSGLHLPGLTGIHRPAVMGSMHHLQRLLSNNQALTLDAFGPGGCHGVH
jgi:hypothetical protein